MSVPKTQIIILKKNSFEFNRYYFDQISGGVAIGTKMGPQYACLFMSHLGHQIWQSYGGKLLEVYRRLVGDSVCVCGGGPKGVVTEMFLDEQNQFVKFFFFFKKK